MKDKELASNNLRAEGAVYLTPAVDIFEDEEGLTLAADLPGISADRLDIAVDKGLLTIEGSALKGEGAEGTGGSNSPPIEYFRRFKLSEVFDGEKAEAEFKDGVLTLKLPRAEAAKPKKIEVRTLN